MRKNWKIRKPDAVLQEKLSKEMGMSLSLAGLLVNRNITTSLAAENFLNAGLSYLHNADLLPDIEKAAKRIHEALHNNEKVLIFSDYDADGITALAILKNAFRRLGLAHEHYLPHRIKEGYGLSRNFIEHAKDKKADLVITLDCGISNFAEIEDLNRLNIDTIVVDHHEPKEDKLPPAYAIIDPKRRDAQYPYRDLAGVGLSYKLASYLLSNNLEEELDLACIGTVADVVSLSGENRIIVKQGLKKINNGNVRLGLKSLLEVAGIKDKEITTEYISYILGPRLNACGRIDSPDAALDLLLCESEEKARELARGLHLKNQERQRIEGKIMEEALDMLLGRGEIDFNNERVIVLHQDGWHQGVLGIVAAKLADKFHRPTVVISCNDKVGRGSARSIANFHLFESLVKCQQYLQNFGGHKHAAGLSILRKDIEDFKKSINRIARETLSPEDLIPSLDIDMELKLEDLSPELIEEIALLAPFGQDNAQPLFVSSGLKIKSKPDILGRDTLKFWVSDGKNVYPAVGFGMGDYFELVNSAQTVDLAYRLSLDTWQGNNQPQLEIADIK